MAVSIPSWSYWREPETEAIHALWWLSRCDKGSIGALKRFEQLLLQRAWLIGQDLSHAERSDWVRQMEELRSAHPDLGEQH